MLFASVKYREETKKSISFLITYIKTKKTKTEGLQGTNKRNNHTKINKKVAENLI